MGWAEIKKAINSNLSKPLDRLIEERVSSLDSRMSRMQSEIDRCSKKYPVFRDTSWLDVYDRFNQNGKTFKYEGSSGVILSILWVFGGSYSLDYAKLKLDGVDVKFIEIERLMNDTSYDSDRSKICTLPLPLEFKNSIEIILPAYDRYNQRMRCFFKTEK